ncbi:MAG: hypothetical protein V2J51_14855 [Erythrobacter sp.]|jgi:hypothetical protein|nr:hypothetical protein [Erythrobacter sp.]
MRTAPFAVLSLVAPFALTLAACGTADEEPQDVAGDNVAIEPEDDDAISGEAIEEAVPGRIDVDPEGTTPNTADAIGSEEDADPTKPSY